MIGSIKENKENRTLLIKLFGLEWIKNRDNYFKNILESRKPKEQQLKLF